MKRLTIGAILGIMAATVAHLLHVPPVWAALIGLGVAAIVWFHIYRLIEDVIDGITDALS